MFFPSFPKSVDQVWPGNGIDVFSVSGAPLRVVTTFSRFLNSETWYFASTGLSAWGRNFTISRGIPDAPVDGIDDWTFAESYLDRAVLNENDWIEYSGLPARQSSQSTPAPVQAASRSFKANLAPVLICPEHGRHPSVVMADPVPVVVQFLTSNDVLFRTAWFIERRIHWRNRSESAPSAFAIRGDVSFEESEPPPSGLRYTGGLRPAPWPG